VSLVTGDAVLLDLRPARVPTRLFAILIDLAILSGATWLWAYVVTAVGGSPARQTAVGLVGGIVILFGYFIAMETATRGRTVGKYALGLRTVRDDGGSIRFRHALLRGLSFWAVDFAVWTGFCGGLICASVQAQGKRIGDLMAGTIVIRTRSPRPPATLDPVPVALSGWAAQLELSQLPDELVTASRHLLSRHDGLMSYPQTQLTMDLARQVAARTAPPPPTYLEPRTFLAAVVAERRERAATRLRAEASGVPTAEQLPAGWR
jgi:uncharacterized RDD family membrane protein YckC